MVGILRETDGGEDQRVDDWEAMQGKSGGVLTQKGEVVADKVVAEKAAGSVSQVVKLSEGRVKGNVPRARQGTTRKGGADFEEFALVRNLEV